MNSFMHADLNGRVPVILEKRDPGPPRSSGYKWSATALPLPTPPLPLASSPMATLLTVTMAHAANTNLNRLIISLITFSPSLTYWFLPYTAPHRGALKIASA
jgi:hypothetical protein